MIKTLFIVKYIKMCLWTNYIFYFLNIVPVVGANWTFQNFTGSCAIHYIRKPLQIPTMSFQFHITSVLFPVKLFEQKAKLHIFLLFHYNCNLTIFTPTDILCFHQPCLNCSSCLCLPLVLHVSPMLLLFLHILTNISALLTWSVCFRNPPPPPHPYPNPCLYWSPCHH